MFTGGSMGEPSFKPLQLSQIVGVEATCAPQPMPVRCKIAFIESIHGKVLSGIFIATFMRSIIQASSTEPIRNSACNRKGIG